MIFRDYLLTLSGLECTVYVKELSAPYRGEDGARWALVGFIEVEEDFIKISENGDQDLPTIVRIDDILVVDVVGTEEDLEEVEEDIKEDDIHIIFEKWYQRERKG